MEIVIQMAVLTFITTQDSLDNFFSFFYFYLDNMTITCLTMFPLYIEPYNQNFYIFIRFIG